MSKVRRTATGISFRCPGCGDTHSIPVNPGWAWNQSLESPTVDPSINVQVGHYAPHWKEGDGCWCGKNYGFECYRCHSTIANGRIFFCPDSTHALAGQTVDLPEVT